MNEDIWFVRGNGYWRTRLYPINRRGYGLMVGWVVVFVVLMAVGLGQFTSTRQLAWLLLVVIGVPASTIWTMFVAYRHSVPNKG